MWSSGQTRTRRRSQTKSVWTASYSASLAAFQVREVMENLGLSIGDPSRPPCVAALQYYFEFDAFIDPSALRRRS